MIVKFLDPKTNEVTEIPEEELAPGCVKIKIAGKPGEYFIAAESIDTANDPIKHRKFTGETKEFMDELADTFRDVHPLSAEEWERGFRQDEHPDKEIAIWRRIVAHYKTYTQRPSLSLEAKMDYFSIIMNFVNSGPEHVRSLVQLRELSQNEMRRVVASLKKSAE